MLVHWVAATNNKELVFNGVVGLDTDIILAVPDDRSGFVEEPILTRNVSSIVGTGVETSLGHTSRIPTKHFGLMLPKLG